MKIPIVILTLFVFFAQANSPDALPRDDGPGQSLREKGQTCGSSNNGSRCLNGLKCYKNPEEYSEPTVKWICVPDADMDIPYCTGSRAKPCRRQDEGVSCHSLACGWLDYVNVLKELLHLDNIWFSGRTLYLPISACARMHVKFWTWSMHCYYKTI